MRGQTCWVAALTPRPRSTSSPNSARTPQKQFPSRQKDLVNGNYKFYQKVSDDAEVSKEFFARLFEWYVEGRKKPSPKDKS
jgi:hypothetical protein